MAGLRSARHPAFVPADRSRAAAAMNVPKTLPTVTWTPLTPYVQGSSVTPQNVNDPAVTLPQYQFVALTQGKSGAIAPAWPSNAGVQLQDGGVTWLCVGIALLDGATQQQPLYPNQ